MATQWLHGAGDTPRPVVTSRSDKVNTCRFVHNECDKELFASEYLRSNKASGHKNLRCFPHCCGGHNPKSFCGAGLVIECFVPTCHLVLGRFEEVAKEPRGKSGGTGNTSRGGSSLVIGHEYARQELLNDVKMADQPFGRWFRGAAVPHGTGSGTWFLLNGNRQSWHYGWQSSRLNCKNLHVFRVYVFNASGNSPRDRISPTIVTCIAALASPAFRISSSRKARKSVRSPAGTLVPPTSVSLAPPATASSLHGHCVPSGTNFGPAWSTQAQRPLRGFLALRGPSTQRDRKRSASLKTDDFSTVACPRHQLPLPPMAHEQSSPALPSGLVNATRWSMPSLPSVDAFFTPGTSHRALHSRRSSLAALPMPEAPAVSVPVLTPITGMRHLRLETPVPVGTPSSVQAAAPLTAAALPPHGDPSTRPERAGRRDTWACRWPFVIPEARATPDSFLNRKRNRSTDSDKAITAAIEASEKIHPTWGHGLWPPGRGPSENVAPVPTDSELYRRARTLQLACTIVKRIYRFDEVVHPTSLKVVRHSFQMLTPSGPGSARASWSVVPMPLRNVPLVHLCSTLVTICTALVTSGFLRTMRHKVRECARAGRGTLAAYQQLVDLVTDAVEAQVARVPQTPSTGGTDADKAGHWDLYEMLHQCEPWLRHEPWWGVRDDDDPDYAGDEDEHGTRRRLPYLSLFVDYYRAIQATVAVPPPPPVAPMLRLAQATGLNGTWTRQGTAVVPQVPVVGPRVAPTRAATAASSLSWLARFIDAHTTSTWHVTETETSVTLSRPHSLVSAHAALRLPLTRHEPTIVPSRDYFPFGWSCPRGVVAYRAWRVRGMTDASGSAIAVQCMPWPDDLAGKDGTMVPLAEPEAEWCHTNGRRTRVTMYFSVFSTRTMQLRTIVESSLAPVAVALAHPTEGDLLKYFKAPSSWELRSQMSHQYTKHVE